jgi:adenylate kinase
LDHRGYAANKITENVEAEIMQVVLDEAMDSYKEDIVIELRSESLEDMEANTEKIVSWINQWKQ